MPERMSDILTGINWTPLQETFRKAVKSMQAPLITRVRDYRALAQLVSPKMGDDFFNWIARVDLAADQQRLHVNKLVEQIKLQQEKIIRQKAALKDQDAAILERNRLLDDAPEQGYRQGYHDLMRIARTEIESLGESLNQYREYADAKDKQIAEMSKAAEKRAEVEGVAASQVVSQNTQIVELHEQNALLLGEIDRRKAQYNTLSENSFRQQTEISELKAEAIQFNSPFERGKRLHAAFEQVFNTGIAVAHVGTLNTFNGTIGKLKAEISELRGERDAAHRRQEELQEQLICCAKDFAEMCDSRNAVNAQISELQEQLRKTRAKFAQGPDSELPAGYVWIGSDLHRQGFGRVAEITVSNLQVYLNVKGGLRIKCDSFVEAQKFAENIARTALGVMQ